MTDHSLNLDLSFDEKAKQHHLFSYTNLKIQIFLVHIRRQIPFSHNCRNGALEYTYSWRYDLFYTDSVCFIDEFRFS